MELEASKHWYYVMACVCICVYIYVFRYECSSHINILHGDGMEVVGINNLKKFGLKVYNFCLQPYKC